MNRAPAPSIRQTVKTDNVVARWVKRQSAGRGESAVTTASCPHRWQIFECGAGATVSGKTQVWRVDPGGGGCCGLSSPCDRRRNQKPSTPRMGGREVYTVWRCRRPVPAKRFRKRPAADGPQNSAAVWRSIGHYERTLHRHGRLQVGDAAEAPQEAVRAAERPCAKELSAREHSVKPDRTVK
jgi:hypothetical protein